MFSLRTLHLDSEVLVAVEGCLHWLMMLGYLNKEKQAYSRLCLFDNVQTFKTRGTTKIYQNVTVFSS